MAIDEKEQGPSGFTPFATAHFKARVDGATPTLPARPSFWRAVGESPDNGEAKLKAKFPVNLTRRLVAASGRPAAQESELRFEIQDLRYGSIEFLIAVSSIKAFAALFAGVSPDVVLRIVQTCVVESFRESIGGNPPSEATVTPSSELLAALSRSAPAGTSWGDVVNASLSRVFWLVPTVLALLVWFVTMSAMDGDSKRVHARESELEKNYREREAELGAKQKAMMDLLKDRVVQLETLTSDMTKQLRQVSDAEKTATPGSCCCPPCCAAGGAPKPPAKPVASRACRK